MAICSNCHAEQPSSDVTTCILCGYPVVRGDAVEAARADDELLDFVVTEADGDSRPFIGGQREGARARKDDLGIETTSDWVQHEANSNDSVSDWRGTPRTSGSQPIGDSSPPPPPQAQYKDDAPSAWSSDVESPSANSEAEDTTDQVKKLSREEIQRIEQNLYGSTSFLKDEDKAQLTKKLNALKAQTLTTEAAVQTVAALSAAEPGPTKSRGPRRATGVAYFYKNLIQVTGQPAPMANGHITIGDREYLLKPKKIKTPYLVGGFALVLTVLLIILGTALSPATSSSEGQLVGVVLDDNDRPYIQGALIHVVENDKRIESDQRGFFTAGMVPVGTYTLEYIMNGHVIGIEQASVTDDEVRMVFLRPNEPEDLAEVPATNQQEPATVAITEQQTKASPTPQTSSGQTSTKTETSSTSKASAQKTSKDPYGKVTLAANVANARFELDGSTLGAGNLTYSKIKTGKHSYRVSADGYEAVEGKLSVESGKTHSISVTLKPLARAQKEQTYQTDDYYYSGTTALQQGEYEAAIADLTHAIDAKPSYAEAYYYRAKAYGNLKMHEQACDDYIRAAEIYQMRKNYGEAISCYNAAIEVDDRAIAAFLGRGNLYLKKGEELAAIADFDKATQIDKRNFQAYYGLGEARFKQQQYKKAVDHFKDARSINDKDPLVYQYLMLSYMALAKYDDVHKTYEKFAEVATEDQMNRFQTDQRYSAVIRVIESQ